MNTNLAQGMELFATTSFLIVDDISAMRSVTKMLLIQLGAKQIHQASNGAEAMKLLARERIDVVLSDWNMPVMSGTELLAAMRAEPKFSALPFILITAEAERQRIQQAIDAGVNGLLVKPYTAAGLAERILRSLGRQRSAAAVAPHDQTSEPAAAAATAVERATLLVVDDTPDNLQLMSGILKDDYRIKVASNGEKALAICHSDNPPDLVLLDIMMPGMDGFEVARRLREHPSSEHLPVIFVTAMSDEDSQQKGMSLGAVDFVTKPINPDALKIRIRNFMRYVDLHRQLQADYDGMLENAQLRKNVENITRHDLKGPLAGIVGLAQNLANSAELTPEMRAKLGAIESTALDVLDMITRSTELYRIEAGVFQLQAQRIAVVDLLRQQVELIRAAFAVKELTLEVSAGDSDETQLAVSGDPMLCRSLFQNLLKNACEAAPEKTAVVVTVHAGSPVRIVVRNSGTVPAEIRECFFEKFSTAGKARGSGLGTYSAKLLAEAQRGSIAMETSEEKNQTRIVVSLPPG